MSAIARRAAFQAARAPLRQTTRRSASGVNSGAGAADSEAQQQQNVLKQGAKRDPELYVWPYPDPVGSNGLQH